MRRADKYIAIVNNPKSSAEEVNKAVKILRDDILPKLNERLNAITDQLDNP
jgi:hypothetical protein